MRQYIDKSRALRLTSQPSDSNHNSLTIEDIDEITDYSILFISISGLGDSADGFTDVAATLTNSMPHVKFIVPTAGSRRVTISGGMSMNAWYDITGLTDVSANECDGIESSVSIVRDIMQNEINLGIRSDRIVLAGFSQGGALSLFTGLQLPIELKPAGVLVMSGYIPGASKFKITPGLENVPVMHLHGTADNVVIFDHAEKTRKHVTDKGLKSYTVKPYSNVGHTINPDMLAAAVEFILSRVPDDPELRVKPKSPSDMTVKELKEAIRRVGLTSKSLGFFEKREFVDLLEGYYKTL